MKAPVILFCNNNQWAISTPVSAQTAAPTLADKAIGYGMPGVRVDGGDVLAVYEATREAVERARAGTGRRSSRPSPIGRHRTLPRTTPPPTSIRSAWTRSARTSASGVTRPTSTARGPLRRPGARDQGRGARIDAGRDRSSRGRAASRHRARVRARIRHATPRLAEDLAELRRVLGGERFLVEAVNDALHGEMERDPSILVMGEDIGRLAGSFARPRAYRSDSARAAASTRLWPRPGFSGRPSACAWRAGARWSRCNTTHSATPRSTS